ncbi:hypothetical protein MNBD_GAMMA08-2462 [hydrothermal vent metagenome]|uniref:Uncharacterized protein n=1 Tax=hydrothermal vent metagenome TaxID=652676 RepID=A0A3B0XE65_9ZZZZ
MSLLLDALKKAADDKNKTTKKPAEKNVADENINFSSDSVNEQTDEHSTDLNLELEMDSGLTSNNQSNETSDAFPEVDDEIIAENKKVIASKSATEKPLTTVRAFSSANNKKPANVEIKDNDSIEDKSAEEPAATKEPEVSLTLTDEKNKTETKDDNEKKLSSTQRYQQNTSKIENEQALSELINKSNLHSQREKLKKNISIGILTGLLLIGSGLYFYIKMQATNQELYIAQKNSAPVQRNIAPPEKAPVKNSTLPAKPTTPKVVPPQKKVSPKKPAVASQPSTTVKAIKNPITFIRTKKSDPIHLLIRKAYDAFHQQDYRQSETLYKKVLTREPKNRDALLGLAAIGTKEKRYEYARQKYQYLLKLDPRDSFAIAGLSGIEHRVDPKLNESQLKFLLKQHPESAHLYFALGSQYAGQKKWAEAQTAFFSAWSAKETNADYAYNLAVSLDHLNKQKIALKFYKIGLKLKQASNGNFSTADAEKRVKTLQANVE